MHWLGGRGWEMPADLSLLPRAQPVGDPEACLPAVLHWHFNPQTAFPHWLGRVNLIHTAVRVPGPAGHVGDSVSNPRPVETFEGDAVIERVP
jgi:hypothetical protein